MYKIIRKHKTETRWVDEKFITGGIGFKSFSLAQGVKKELEKMCSSFKYKVVKAE